MKFISCIDAKSKTNLVLDNKFEEAMKQKAVKAELKVLNKVIRKAAEEGLFEVKHEFDLTTDSETISTIENFLGQQGFACNMSSSSNTFRTYLWVSWI